MPPDAPIDPFVNVIPTPGLGGESYARFFAYFGQLQDAVVTANPPQEIWDQVSELTQAALDLLTPWAAPEKEQPAGTRVDLPGRGNPMLIPFVKEEESPGHVSGRAEFRPFHLGGHAAAHGGTLPLLFDEVMGRVANADRRAVARTAYLKVNYRNITPLGRWLHVEASLDRQEGRKRWISGRLTDGATLVADAEGLFIELLPGQP
ncbi:MAG TPA: PaaI family thioesterase [Acidimicrobiales bacterium]|jgi:acyl-coenzyme A thioesterase PaaI-like protein|nr:PaaI family thioesterase [Acidimicrobiales bacterium]